MIRERMQHSRLIKRRAARRLGYVLMEVVVAISLLLVGMTYIGAQVQKTEEAAHASEDLTRIMMLIETKMAELDTGLVFLDEEADQELEGDFSLRFPDYGWRMRFEDTATESLRAITLDILYAPRLDLDTEFDVDNAKVVHTVYTLRQVPPKVDLAADFGLDEETIERLTEDLPMELFDPAAFDVAGFFRDTPTEDLMAMLPALMQAFGISSEQLANVLPAELRDLINPEGSETQPSDTTLSDRDVLDQLSPEDRALFEDFLEPVIDGSKRDFLNGGSGRQQQGRGGRGGKGGGGRGGRGRSGGKGGRS